MHKIPLTESERSGLVAHGLKVDEPSQLSDAFRLGFKYALSQKSQWTEDEEAQPEAAQIHESHPLQSNRHDLYAEALRLVSARRSKYSLVDLVNWLLHKAEPKPISHSTYPG
ncbi:MAG: hypothetical protein ACRCVX_03885 [Shewanella sp.]